MACLCACPALSSWMLAWHQTAPRRPRWDRWSNARCRTARSRTSPTRCASCWLQAAALGRGCCAGHICCYMDMSWRPGTNPPYTCRSALPHFHLDLAAGCARGEGVSAAPAGARRAAVGAQRARRVRGAAAAGAQCGAAGAQMQPLAAEASQLPLPEPGSTSLAALPHTAAAAAATIALDSHRPGPRARRSAALRRWLRPLGSALWETALTWKTCNSARLRRSVPARG